MRSRGSKGRLCLAGDMGNEFVVLREDDPRRADVESRGYTVVGQSWGARLELADAPDLSVFREALSRAERAGISVSELPVTASTALQELERDNTADYPYTPATAHELLDAEATRDLWNKGFRVFGGRDGDLNRPGFRSYWEPGPARSGWADSRSA